MAVKAGNARGFAPAAETAAGRRRRVQLEAGVSAGVRALAMAAKARGRADRSGGWVHGGFRGRVLGKKKVGIAKRGVS